MKKLLVLIPLFLVLASASVIAQGGGQGQGGGGQAQFMEQQKQRLKDSLGLTAAQVETVMTINQEFQPRTREIRRDQNMSETDKEAKLKVITEERQKKLAAALKDEALATKIEEFNARMMAQMRNRPRGNN